jgi:NodT family efflux transporter outer membrane factor (OMF) lipoprotein
MKANRRILSGSLAFVLAGCSVGPDYVRPALELPGEFSRSASGIIDESARADSFDLRKWWVSFNDPILDRLIEVALERNLDLELAQARVREARGIAVFARSDFFPFVNPSAAFERSDSSDTANQGREQRSTAPRNLYSTGFDATWEIDIFGGTRRRVESADEIYESRRDAKRDVHVTLVAEVAQSYTALRAAQRRISIAEETISAEQESLSIQRTRFEAGLASDLTVAQSEGLLKSTIAQLPPLETSRDQAIHRLSILLGREPNALREYLIEPAAIPVGPTSIPTGIPSELLRRRPDIRAAEHQLASATADIGVAVSEFFPKLTLLGTAGFESNLSGALFDAPSRFWSAGGNLHWNILNFNAVLDNIEIKNALQEQALIQYKQTVLKSLEEVENALVAHEKEIGRSEALAAGLEANRRALKSARHLYDAGVVDFLNVLVAQQSVYQSEDQLTQSEQAISTTLISLYKALGGGWEFEPAPEEKAALPPAT